MTDIASPRFNPSSRKRRSIQDTRADSYRHSLVWRWLNEGVRAGPDPIGNLVMSLRKRIDMPRSFPTKLHMRNYLTHCGLNQTTIRLLSERLWVLYHSWVEATRHDTSLT